MYCKHCGKQIADDSRFCQHCGGNQEDTTIASSTDFKPDSPKQKKVVEIPTIKTNFSDSTKWWICGYCLWVVLNLYWLFADDKFGDASRSFLPFTEDADMWCRAYDFTEFIVYVFGLPLIIWGLIMLNKKLNSNTQTTNSTLTQVKKNEKNKDINDALGL